MNGPNGPLGITVNEFYGQTECNIVLGSMAAVGVTRPGAIGRVTAGHTVAIIDGDGKELPRGSAGQIAVKRPDPVMFPRLLEQSRGHRQEIPSATGC